MFILKSFKCCVLEVRILKGLRVCFAEVRILRELAMVEAIQIGGRGFNAESTESAEFTDKIEDLEGEKI